MLIENFADKDKEYIKNRWLIFSIICSLYPILGAILFTLLLRSEICCSLTRVISVNMTIIFFSIILSIKGREHVC